MNLRLIIKILLGRRYLKRSASLTRADFLINRSKALKELRKFTYYYSPFYRSFHQGFFDKPLCDLPVLTKKMMMENFDTIVTDDRIKKSELVKFIEGMTVDDRYKNKYVVNTTGGTTGLKGIFVYNDDEWSKIIASYSRANDWAGLHVNAFTRLNIAVVSSTVAWHQSSGVGSTLQTPFISTLRIDATDPVEEIVERLNIHKPELLVAYPSMAFVLAGEQLKGNLKIQPKVIFCAAEVLTNTMRDAIRSAWNITPFNVYAATETAGIASECIMHDGMHIYEDLVIIEVVDAQYKPVPPGAFGSKLLVTVLFSRTIPLIRYELTDRIMLSDKTCECGLPFKMIKEIQGREEDIITLGGNDGSKVKIHPNLFHKVLEKNITDAWQIIQTAPNTLMIKVAGKLEEDVISRIKDALRMALGALGVSMVIIEVNINAGLERTLIGKNILIKALKP